MACMTRGVSIRERAADVHGRRGAGVVLVLGAALAGLAGLAAAPGCSDYGPVTLASPNDGGPLGTQLGRGVGAACSNGEPCRNGLVCKDAACAPGRVLDDGAACVISAECKEGLHCSGDHRCRPSGRAAATEPCTSEADCASGNRCNPVGLTAECAAEGPGDIGADCTTGASCYGGLLCVAGKCAQAPETKGTAPLAIPTWTGVACEPEDDAPARAHFRVPRGDASADGADGDWFRLPFPNDVRKDGARLVLTGFPTPGAEVLGFDLVDRWRAWAEQNAGGFSPWTSVTLRFGGPVDFETLKGKEVLRFVDLTAGTDVGFAWGATSARSPYLCGSSVTVRPGAPLAPGHTFAVLVSGAAQAKGGGPIAAPDDFRALVAGADPGGVLAKPWAAYAPLRAWAAAKGVDLASTLVGTVFTTSSPRALVRKTAEFVAGQASDAPFEGWVKCGVGPSPCPGAAGDRACPAAADPQFDELHALVTLPVLQKGTAPFRAAADDGDVVLGADGSPTALGTQKVCVSLSVPKAVMPAGGWPLVLYAHDTGDHFRSHVARGLAKRFANADAGAANVAVLGFDQVGHGTRKQGGVSVFAATMPTWSPGAMRGVTIQGVADVFGLVRAAQAVQLTAGASPTSNAIRFSKTILFGHGQGATAVALAATEATSAGVILAGHGGSFLDAVPVRTRPASFAGVAPLTLGEAPLTSGSPVLSLLQTALDPVDPLQYAGPLLTSVAGVRHVFMVSGVGDAVWPAASQSAYALAAGLAVAAPAQPVSGADVIGPATLPIPAGGNSAGGTVTAVIRQYVPGSGDGHDVVFTSSDAVTDVDRFVADVARGVVPKIGR
jgi:hypothetical protein